MPHICLSGLATQENLKDLSFCKRSKLQIILFIMRISFVKIISSVISVASIGCFNAQAANWNTDSFDYSNLKVIEVPSGFPERSQEVSLRCNADNGNSWTFRLQAFYSNDFFWAYDHGRNNRTLFVGKRTSSDKFVIRSSQARSKKRDQPDYLTISINSPNLHEALLSGKFGGQRGGNNWWEKCLISTDRFSKALSTSSRYGQLKSAIARQKFGLPAMAEFGIAAKQKYNFEALRDALEPEYIAIVEARKAKRMAEFAAKKKAEEEAKRAAELAAKKKAVEEAKRAAELAAKKKAEEEAKRAAELAAKKKAEEEAKRAAELAAKKKAEEEAKRAAELAAKKKAEEEARRAAELAAKKKAEEEARRAAELAAKDKAQREAEKKAKQLEDLLKAKEAKMAELKKQLAAAEERNKKLANAQSKQKKEDDRKQAISEAIKTGPQKIETTLKLQSLNVGELGNEFGDGFNNFSARQNHRLLPVYLCVENTGAEGFDISSKISFGVGFKDATFVMASDEGTIAWNSQENINELSKSVAANKKACGVKVFEVPIEKTKALDTIFIERSGVVIVKRGIK